MLVLFSASLVLSSGSTLREKYMNFNKTLTAVGLPLIAMSSMLTAARGDSRMANCAPTPPVPCNPDNCKNCYCLGPENYGVNAPVCPKTCNGDFIITVAGFYWNAHQDGMEYAINNNVVNPGTTPSTANIQQLNNLVDAEYLTPNFKWDFGFKIGLGYCTTCDGWDFGVTWTWYRGKANGQIEAEPCDNQTLLPLWSAFSNVNGSVVYACDIEHNWRLRLNLIDLELGRNFWTSKYLAIRPHVGIRIAYIQQSFDLFHKGGSWASFTGQTPLNNDVDLDNDFHGVGVRAGLNSEWNLGCGWAIYGNWAASIIYGRFSIDHDEENRQAIAPHLTTDILETHDSFRASRAILDLALGIQWSSMVCDCKYGFTGMIGWEHHLFFDQNQLWRVVRIGDTATGQIPNNTGENVFSQRRGDLDTQGWTLTFKFEF